MQVVNIYGLSMNDISYLSDNYDGDNWVINDWYQFTGWIEPTRIFNLHRYPHIHASRNRFIGDWKAAYNRAGVPVYCIEDIEGVDNTVVLDPDKLLELCGSKNMLSCSISTMVWQAIYEGYELIRIIGVNLTGSEYKYQIDGILRSINAAESRGIKISVQPFGRLDHWKELLKDVEWESVEDFKYCYWDNPVGKITVTSKMLPDVG